MSFLKEFIIPGEFFTESIVLREAIRPVPYLARRVAIFHPLAPAPNPGIRPIASAPNPFAPFHKASPKEVSLSETSDMKLDKVLPTPRTADAAVPYPGTKDDIIDPISAEIAAISATPISFYLGFSLGGLEVLFSTLLLLFNNISHYSSDN